MRNGPRTETEPPAGPDPTPFRWALRVVPARTRSAASLDPVERVRSLDRGLAIRPHADHQRGHLESLLDRAHVVAGGGRQILQRARVLERVAPAREHAVD